MAAKVSLTKGLYCIVDDEDFIELSKYKWHARKAGSGFVAARGYWDKKQKRVRTELMTRYVMKANNNQQVDHINHNTLDNRKCNLRLCSPIENCQNRLIRCDNSSGYKGVSLKRESKKWGAHIYNHGKQIFLGYFTNKIDAAIAYNEAAIKYFGNYASLNNI